MQQNTKGQQTQQQYEQEQLQDMVGQVGQAEQVLQRLIAERRSLEQAAVLLDVYKQMVVAVQQLPSTKASLEQQVQAVQEQLTNAQAAFSQQQAEQANRHKMMMADYGNQIAQAQQQLVAVHSEIADSKKAADVQLTEQLQAGRQQLAVLQEQITTAQEQYQQLLQQQDNVRRALQAVSSAVLA